MKPELLVPLEGVNLYPVDEKLILKIFVLYFMTEPQPTFATYKDTCFK